MLTAAAPIPIYHPKKDGFDVDVVSAEGVTYRADRQKLAEASSVFRNILMMNSTLRLNERSATLGPFLDVILGAADLFPVINDRAPILGALDILLLMKKYDCTTALTYALTSLKCMMMERDVCALETFILGAAVDDVTLCRTAIVYSDGNSLEAHATATARGYWEAVPAKYRNALARAWEAKDPKDKGNLFVQEMYLKDDSAEDATPSYDSVFKTKSTLSSETKSPGTRVQVLPVETRTRTRAIPTFQIDDDPFFSDDDE